MRTQSPVEIFYMDEIVNDIINIQPVLNGAERDRVLSGTGC